MALQKPTANEVADRPLDGVIFLEVPRMRVKRLGGLRDRQLRRVLFQKERENDALIPCLLSEEGIETTGSRIRNALTSPEGGAPPLWLGGSSRHTAAGRRLCRNAQPSSFVRVPAQAFIRPGGFRRRGRSPGRSPLRCRGP